MASAAMLSTTIDSSRAPIDVRCQLKGFMPCTRLATQMRLESLYRLSTRFTKDRWRSCESDHEITEFETVGSEPGAKRQAAPGAAANQRVATASATRNTPAAAKNAAPGTTI